MVTPMIKYTFLLHHSQKERLLNLLGQSAIVDITVSNWSASESDSAVIASLQRATLVRDKLVAISEKNSPEIDPNVNSSISADQIIEQYESKAAQLEQLLPLLIKYEQEIEQLSVWGDFNSTLITNLKNEGLYVHPYSAATKSFDNQWITDYNGVVCSIDSSLTYFVIVDNNEKPQPLEGAKIERTLTYSCKERKADLLALEQQIESLTSQIATLSLSVEVLNSHIELLSEQLMESKVLQTTESLADGYLLKIEGYSPVDKCDELDSLIDGESSILTFKEKPKMGDDDPPILLKNNRFSRLTEVITRMYALPRYSELDLTPFFAPFFVFFVGICLGDLGYGALLFSVALFVYLKFRNSEYSDLSALVMWCSAATMIMGCVTGTFFGISLANVESLKHLPFLGSMDMFTFSLIVGIIQILYAMFVKAFYLIKCWGWRYGVSTLSWAMLIIVSGFAYLGKDMGVDISLNSIGYQIVAALLLAAFIFFSDPTEKNPLKNIGSGIWNLYNGVTGALGDVLSYVRLFAIGLSSGILGGVFNDLAFGLSPDIPVVRELVILMILLVGHSMNLFMSMISSFVHPLRLTFVEFYKNAGFEGGGREYAPFKKSK